MPDRLSRQVAVLTRSRQPRAHQTYDNRCRIMRQVPEQRGGGRPS